jgi:hypothetical protein
MCCWWVDAELHGWWWCKSAPNSIFLLLVIWPSYWYYLVQIQPITSGAMEWFPQQSERPPWLHRVKNERWKWAPPLFWVRLAWYPTFCI